MDDDFVDVFPSAGGVGDSPVKTEGAHLGPGSPWPRPPVVSLSIPGLDTGGAAAAVSPAIQGSRGVAATRSPVKESVFRSARAVMGTKETDLTPDSPAASPPTLTIDPGGECVPTELEKKRAKLEKYRYECSEVSESFLYVSGEDAAKQQGLVSSKGITHIINCAGPQCVNYLEYTGRFNFLRLNFYDDRTEDVAWFLYSAFDFIKAAQAQKGRVLVHCVQGVSRSCALAIGWLMLTAGIDYDEAYVRVRQARPICAPNTGFICSLLEWQRRRAQLPSSPLLYRTAWHMPRFPNDLVLKLCLHEEDRKHVTPTLAALDSRGCHLLIVPKKSSCANFLSAGSKRESEALMHNSARSQLSVPSSPRVPPFLSSAAERAAAAVAAAAAANAKAAAAVAAAEEAKARAKAAAAEEAVMVAKAVEAGVAIPLKWRESHALATKEGRDPPQTRIRISTEPRILPLPRGKLKAQAAMQAALISAQASALSSSSSALAVDRAGESKVARAPQEEQACKADATAVDVYVWEGSQSCSQMLELAKKGARWLREYEGWGSGANAPIVQEGKEPPEMLRHLLHPKDNDVREPPVYGDLIAPSPPPTAGRTPSSRSFPACPTPSAHGSRRAPVLSPADMPTLSPAGPSPSPGGVGFSPYSCGFSPAGVTFEMPTVSPAGSTAVSPATQDRSHNTGGGDSRHDSLRNDSLRIDSLRNDSLCGSVNDSRQNSLVLRCSLASAPEDMEEDGDDDEDWLRGERASSGLESRSVGCVTVGAGRGRGAQARPKLFELADELGGQGKSGLRWSQLSIFDDQDLLSQCCFLLVSPGAKNFLWVGKAFAGTYAQAGDMQQIHALARDVAIMDARRGSDRLLPCSSDVESATLVPGDGNEPEEWWSAFESGYA